MSTFLALCQSLRQNATDSGVGPATVIGQTGELARFVSWVSDGYVDLQNDRQDWKWLHKYFTVNATAGDGDYAYADCNDAVTGVAIDRFSHWWQYEFKAYLTSDGVGTEYPLAWADWNWFRRIYRYGTQAPGQPRHVSVDNTMKFVLGPVPDAVYTVSGGYQRGPQILAVDADIPELPTRFHQLLMYEGLSRYGGNRIAPEAMVRAISEGGLLRSALEMDQLPTVGFGGPLA